MPAVESLDFRSFARRFSPNGGMPPSELLTTLRKQRKDLNPTGWMLIECHMVDSSRFGDRMVIAYGPTCTIHEVPTHPFSPRGLASDMSVVVATMPVDNLPENDPIESYDRTACSPHQLCEDVDGKLWEFISYPWQDDTPVPDDGFTRIHVRVPGDPTTLRMVRAIDMFPQKKGCQCAELGEFYYRDERNTPPSLTKKGKKS